MSQFEVGELVFKLTGDPKGLVQSNATALQSFTALNNNLVKYAGVAAAAWVGAGTAMVTIFKKVINELDELQASAQSIGVPLQDLTGLKYAGELANVSIGDLTISLNLLNRQLGTALSTETGKAAAAFKAMGISITGANGQVRSSKDLLLDVADKFHSYQDGANKSAIALDLFGRSGARMVPFLNQGRDAIVEATVAAKEMGVVIDTGTGAAVNAFNDKLLKISTRIEGFATQLTLAVMPEASRLADIFDKLVGSFQVNDATVQAFSRTLDAFVVVIYSVVEAFALIIRETSDYTTAIGKFWSSLMAGDVAAAFKNYWKDLGGMWTDLTGTMTRLGGTIREIMTPPEGAMAEWDKLASHIQDITGGLDRLPKTWQVTLAPTLPDQAEIDKQIESIVASYHKELEDKLADPQLSEAVKVDAITTAFKNAQLGIYDYGQALKKVHQENRDNITSLASDTATALTTIFQNNKAAGIAAAIINTAVGITEAMKLPPPFDIAKAALVGATGAAQIAAIMSTSATGGGASAPSVASGGGTSAAVAPADAAPTPVVNTLHVTGLNPSSLFTGDSVSVLADQLLQFQKDGGKVVLGDDGR